MARIETSGRFAGSLLLADLILCSLVILAYTGFALNLRLDLESSALLAGAVVIVNLVCLVYAHAWPAGATWRGLRLILANTLAALVVPLTYHWLEIGLDRHSTCAVLALFTPLQLLLHHVHTRNRTTAPLEPLRWTLAAAGGFAVGFPFLTNASVGTGDAYWYANMVADFTTQWRAGIFPVFVGQSDFAFNGSINPLRFAPYLQHVGGVLDAITGHGLSFFGLLNITVFASLLATAFTTYGALLVIGPHTRWLALMLALLFVSSPGVLPLAYSGDLFMSVCALPYVPLALLALHLTYKRRDTASVCFLSTSLAALWLCHAPIACWVSLLAALSQLIRLVSESHEVRAWRGWVAGAALFGALAAFVFVSVTTLHLPEPNTDRGLILKNLADSFPAVLLPVSDGANDLSDFQLGWSLWGVLFVGLAGAVIRRRRFDLTLLLGTILCLLLLMPVPHLQRALWLAVPQVVCNITFYWPMQRLYPLLAALAVFMAYATCTSAAARRWWLQALYAGALLVGLQWSASEAGPFLRRGLGNVSSAESSRLSHLPANRVMTRYAYSPFPAAPPYFSHGYVNPDWENRLLAPNSFREITSNYRAAIGPGAIVRSEGEINAAQDSSSKFYPLLSALPIEPGRHYALEFDFTYPDVAGTLIASSTTLSRVYNLPDSGSGISTTSSATSFGALQTSKRAFALRSSSNTVEKLAVQFVSNDVIARDISHFGHYALKEYDPTHLPVVIEAWTPYRARVTAPERAWLETPRMFTAGYKATVNDKPVPVARSPDGLVMLPVGPGENHVTLTYPGPVSLRLSYFLSLATWIGLAVVGGLKLWQVENR